MKTNILHYKKTSFTVLSAFFLLASFSAVAQIPGSTSSKPKPTAKEGKSVYDVVPGSGPKKTTQPAGSGKSVYDVVPGSGPKKTTANYPHGTEPAHHDKEHYGKKSKHKHLPPGQAKKIYGGSATDYAPGQVKKKEGHGNGNGQGHDDDKKNHDKNSGKEHHAKK